MLPSRCLDSSVEGRCWRSTLNDVSMELSVSLEDSKKGRDNVLLFYTLVKRNTDQLKKGRAYSDLQNIQRMQSMLVGKAWQQDHEASSHTYWQPGNREREQEGGQGCKTLWSTPRRHTSSSKCPTLPTPGGDLLFQTCDPTCGISNSDQKRQKAPWK